MEILTNILIFQKGQKADDRKVLDKVPETFDKLVKERGPLGAVRSIVGLLMDGS
jgi:hypothetical protein